MFYKNVLEVIPVFMFGFLSVFSGTQIYNNFMYMTFNLFYTSWPIIWFATFDYEYPKNFMIRRPRLYRIGMDNVFFSKWVFWRWIFYAVWQSTLIVFLAYYSLVGLSPQSDGENGGVYLAGEFVFGALVIVANMKILISSYNIGFWLLFFVIGSTLFYIFVYWFLSTQFTASNEFGTFYQVFSNPQSYFIILLFASMFVLIDTGN